MAQSDLTRRQALNRIALLGAAGFAPLFLEARAARAADLTVGFIYIGPRDDWGWNQSFAAAAEALSALPGVDVIEAGYLPESTNYADGKSTAETEAYLAALKGLVAADGARIVFTTSFGNDPFLLATAASHAAAAFRNAAASPWSRQPNLASQNGLINQGHYVNGVAAGLCTRTNKLGFVAGEAFGTVLLNVNSFLIGSRRSNAAATVQVTFTGGWEDAGPEAAATNALIDAGCDVIACHLDSPKVVIETAEGRGVRTCGHAFDQAPLAPKGYVTGAEYRWAGLFGTFVELFRRGETLPDFITGGYDKGYVGSSPFGAGATPQAIAAAGTAIEAMRKSEPIFVGPIRDNAGKVVIPAGTTYGPYAAQLQSTAYLIEGVIGSIP